MDVPPGLRYFSEDGMRAADAAVLPEEIYSMKRPILLLSLSAALAVVLSGCFFRSVDDLYTVPEAPEEYWDLQNQMKEVKDRGGEYIAPLTGEYIQSVQLQDLNGDGIQEAIAFFRVSTDEKPLKIYIYNQTESGYATYAVIEGAGTAINSVAYEQLDDSPAKELVVSWQMSDKLHSLAAYTVEAGEVVELLRTDYTEFRVYDMDQDAQKEVLVVQTGTGDGENQVELYNCHGGVVTLESAAPLSHGVSTLVDGGVTTGCLQDGVPALFVSSAYGEKGYLTDIFAWKDEAIRNITLAETGGFLESTSTVRWYNDVAVTDINGDGITEVPLPVPMRDANRVGTVSNFWSIRWRQYDADGQAWPVFTTYHNVRDQWYFILPDEWEGKIILERRDSAGGGERAVVFSYWEDTNAAPRPFLTIYALSGTNRESMAAMPGRFSLVSNTGEDATSLYVAEFHDCEWDCGLDEAQVIENFHLIKSAWSSEG